MPNGHRGLGIAALIAALFIAFGIGAYWTGLPYPQERYQTYQGSKSDENGAPSTVANIAGSVVERTPCHNPKSESESDLCAQWRAAKAAEKSADWTLYGVIASAIGISFLLWQIMLTREAVKDTGDATAAMLRQNEIAENAQRPWIKITARLLDFKIHEQRAMIGTYEVVFENIGQMVAENFQPRVKFAPVGEGIMSSMKAVMDAFPGDLEEIDSVLIPNDTNIWKGQFGHAVSALPWVVRPGSRKECYLTLIAMTRYRIPGSEKWRYAMQGFVVGENISPIDDCAFLFDSLEMLDLDRLLVRKFGRSRAT